MRIHRNLTLNLTNDGITHGKSDSLFLCNECRPYTLCRYCAPVEADGDERHNGSQAADVGIPVSSAKVPQVSVKMRVTVRARARARARKLR